MAAIRRRRNREECKEDDIPEEYRPQKGRKTRTWLFTFNNYDDEDMEAILKAKAIWIFFAEEVGPTTGTPHLQGFFLFANPVSWTSLYAQYPGCWFKPAGGSPHHQYLYITKTRPERWCKKEKCMLPADPVPNAPETIHEAGIRPNFGAQAAANKENSKRGGEATRQLWEDAFEAAKVGDWDNVPAQIQIQCLPNLERIYQREKAKVQPEDLSTIVWRPWQQHLWDKVDVDMPIDPRSIIWVWERTGNVGKTWFAERLVRNRGAQKFTGGKTADVAHALTGDAPIVIFDFSRTQEEHVNYGVMEDIKNGMIFSPKYQSLCKVFTKPHLIVFANFPCPEGKFSADRMDVMDLNNWHPPVWTPQRVPRPIERDSPIAPRGPVRPASLASNFVMPTLQRSNCVDLSADDYVAAEYPGLDLETEFNFDFLRNE